MIELDADFITTGCYDMTESKRVFISYSHDDEEHRERVRFLSDKLRSNGINCRIDQSIEHDPSADWSLWMEDEIEDADFVLVVCTPTYYERYRNKSPEGEGLGVRWEGAILRRELYNKEKNKSRFIPIFFSEPNKEIIPDPISETTYYQPLTDEGYESLYHRLTNTPIVETLPVKNNGLKLKTKKAYTPEPKNLDVNLPPRNLFFTGRDDILTNLHDSFNDSNSLAITQAIKGLGGVGKSETAVEYAFRYRKYYDAVFWVRAETFGEVLKDFALIGAKLGITGSSDTEIFEHVKSWLEQNNKWLLVLDNVEDLKLVQQIIPSPCNGCVLITTRSNALGKIKRYSLDCMNDDDGALLLLRRASIIDEQDTLQNADEDQQQLAKDISHALGGLPLALDQAGAYIEEKCYGLDEYLEDYKDLLGQRGELSQDTHLDSVTVTFTLCFNKVKQKNPESAQLLEMCAFLAPDDIPEEIFTDGLQQDKKTFRECIAAAARLSLLDRNTQNKTFSIHRLVQEVLRQGMDEDKHKVIAERCVRAMDSVYPHPDYENWPQCSRLTPHAQSLFTWIVDYSIETDEAAIIFNRTSYYLNSQARYAEAELLCLQAIEIGEKMLGAEHPILAIYLNNLAGLYYSQGKYEQAEPLFLRVIEIGEKMLGAEYPTLASYLNNLAELYRVQGKYEQAEPLIKRVIEIKDKALDKDHPGLASSISILAIIYNRQGKYEEAELLYLRAIEIFEKALGKEHPNVATALNNLSALYYAQGKYEEAEPLYIRAIEIDEKALGKEHPGLATALNNLAVLYRAQGKYEDAEPLYLRVIEIFEKTLLDDHPNLATGYMNYAIFLKETGREAEARVYAVKAQVIHEKRGG
jgi:tetratricopeptide (TPR) repeat protein